MNKENPYLSKFPQVVIVDASAGSGKTYALANHYLKLLFNATSNPKQIDNILAVTFTNKAAREMKERILDLLKKIALDKFVDAKEEKILLSGLGQDKKEAQCKAVEFMDYIIANYNFFQIKTIDSFINMILLGCAYRLGLSANFKIKDDRREYLIYSLDDCIDRANHDKDTRKLFDAFLHQYIYLEEKSSWLPKTDMVNIVGTLFYHSNVYGGRFAKFDADGKSILRGKQGLIKRIRDFSEKAPDNLNGTFRNTIERFASSHQDSFDFSEFTKKTFMKDELPVTKGGKLPAEIEGLWKDIRSEMAALAEKEARSLFNCYIDIFDLVYEVFRKSACKEDIIFLEELNQQACGLINENGVTVPERYYGIAARLKHFLIDEFQDTSILQWNNLYPMIDEALSTGGSLFYVGDKKQAIFRFRGGDVSLFNSIKEAFASYVKQESLKVNYRSQKEIIEFNNKLFSQENLRRFLLEQQPADNELKQFTEEDILEILDIFSSPSQEYKEGAKSGFGYVLVDLPEYRNSEEKKGIIKDKFLKLVKRLDQEKRFSLKDIAVLCRGNADVELVSGWLIENNIAVESEKTLNIKNNQFIKELISLLKFLNSPIDNLSFSSFILGDIFLQAAGFKRQKMQDFLFQIKEKTRSEHGFYIYREFRKTYPDTWDTFIEDLFDSIGFIGLYELVIDIFKRLKVLENFLSQQGFFMHFLQMVKDSEEEHQGVGDFLEYLEDLKNEKLYVNSSGVEAVKVMTIHKAKGLGFGVVIIPFLEFDTSYLGATNRAAAVSYVVEHNKESLSLLRLDKKYALISPDIRLAYRQEYKKTFIDGLNTLYVALTRAKDEMYIFIPYLAQKNNNIAKSLIPDGYLELGKVVDRKKDNHSVEKTLSISLPEYREWTSFLKEDFKDSGSIKNRKNILEGKILHEMLSCIGNLDKTDKEASFKKALGRAASLFPYIADFSDFESIIRSVVDSKELRGFFYAKDALVYQEKDVVDGFGITKRIDRMIVAKDEAWIVDYKFKGESALDYKEQLDSYRSITSELYPEKSVRAFILFLEDCRIEEVHG